MGKKAGAKMEQAIKYKSSDFSREEISSETRKLAKSMKYSQIRNDPEMAKRFLADLSMFDSDGKLKKR